VAKRKVSRKPAKVTERAALPRRVLGVLWARPLASLIVISVVLGLAWMIRVRPVPFSDYRDYFVLARDLADEFRFGFPMPTARRLPGYPALLALPTLISQSFLWLGLFNVVLTAALLPIAHRLTFLLTGSRRMALTAAAVCAVNPTFVFFSPIVASEHLFVLLFFSSLVLVFTPRLRPMPRAALSGFLLGLAILTRGEAVFYSPIVVCAVWVTTSENKLRKLAAAVLTLVVCIGVTLPWAIRNRVVMGPGIGLSTVAGVNFYFGHNSTQYGFYDFSETPLAGLDEVEQHRRGYDLGLAYLSADPLRLLDDITAGTPLLLWQPGIYAPRAGLYKRESRGSYTVTIRLQFPPGVTALVRHFYRAMLLVVVVGLLLYRRISRRAALILYGVATMNWACYAVVFWSKPRFRYTTEVVFCILAGIVLCQIWEIARDFWIRRRARA
jgi:4-amino-4-deoxy-L-arabinose transferase-like glycosyltransferase